MLDWNIILPSIAATLAGAGWFKSWQNRRHDRETHNKELLEKEAEIIAKMRESETKYTREAIEIYNEQVVKPIREQSQRNSEKLARLEGAIAMAPTCRIYPDCVILRCLHSSAANDINDPHRVEDDDGHDDFDPCQ